MKLRFLFLLTGCVIPSALGTSDTDDVDGSSTTELPMSSSSTTESSGSSASVTSASTMEESSTASMPDACADVEPVDNPEMWNCSTEDDQCPACHKCTFRWDGGEINPTETGTVCVPVALDPQGPFEPCTYGDEPGYDNCDAESICWSPDWESSSGYCIPRCGVNLDCEEGTFCLGTPEDEIGCVPRCDPLAPSCLDPTEQCLSTHDGFACLPEYELLAGLGEPCDFGCGEGLYCLPADLAGPECMSGVGCCVEVCDLESGGCTDPEDTCLPSCMTGISDPPHVGACGIEPAELPATCPPPGIEPNIPWCSTENADACPDNAFGGGDDCVEECFCGVPCSDVDECAIPETGNASMLCEPIFEGKPDICLLSCEDGETCPDGMHCSVDFYPGRCMWLYELEPGCAG